MCIAILNSPNVTLPKATIKNCWDNNRDGGGMIWSDVTTNELHIYKEVKSFESFYNKYCEIRKNHPKSNVVLHFRISTSGGVNETNCHPFQVNKELAFVHNGIITELNGIDAKKSDTNLFNEMYLRKLPSDFLYNDSIVALIKKFIGSSKLIFLNGWNEYTIVNENLGVRDAEFEGCWFSNSTYKKVSYVDYGGTKIYNSKPSYGYNGKTYYANESKWDTPKTKAVEKTNKNSSKQMPLYWSDITDEEYDNFQNRYDVLRNKAVAELTDSEWEEMEYLKWYCI